MQLNWTFEPSEIEAVKSVVEKSLGKGRRAVCRQRKNVQQ